MNSSMKVGVFSLSILLLLAVIAGVAPAPVAAGVAGNYLYSLSNFDGTIPYTWARLYLDEKAGETYVADGTDIRVFNGNGMEIYSFNAEGLGNIQDITVDPDGNILFLTGGQSLSDFTIVKCNFRGEFLAVINVKDILPADVPSLRPDTLLLKRGHLYLVDKSAMQILMVDLKGKYVGRYDLVSILKLANKEKSGAEIVGFNIDGEGNMLFTVPVLFTAYQVSPDRKVKAFGAPGSSPGKFNIVAGITTDIRGYCYVADTLRSVVMVFDNTFKFVMEFGYRGAGKENLVGPRDLTVDGNGLLYITQLAKRGISVFRITYN